MLWLNCHLYLYISLEKNTILKIFLFLHKKNVVGTHLKCLGEACQMSTHIMCFRGEIRKNIDTIFVDITKTDLIKYIENFTTKKGKIFRLKF